LEDHQSSGSCRDMPESLKEGIDDDQWKNIAKLLKVERGTKKKKSDHEKWLEMWDIIFHGLDRPDSPCKWLVRRCPLCS
jgi:hypothetical protein